MLCCRATVLLGFLPEGSPLLERNSSLLGEGGEEAHLYTCTFTLSLGCREQVAGVYSSRATRVP